MATPAATTTCAEGPQSATKAHLRIEEVECILGCSRRQVYNLIHAGNLLAVSKSVTRLGGRNGGRGRQRMHFSFVLANSVRDYLQEVNS
jgi:predicted DNA-binding transcriptional regulator AlpA